MAADSRTPALIPPQSDMRTMSEICSAGLRKLLTEGPDGSGAIRIVAVNAVLRAECERALPVLLAAKEPATDAQVMESLVRHATHYGVHAKSKAEWAALFGVYLDALQGLPLLAIEDAFTRWNRGEGFNGDLRMAGFYPKAPQLCILAEKAKVDLYMAAYRAKKALEYVERRERPDISEEERAKVMEGMKALREQLGAKSIPGYERPNRSPQQVAADLRAMADPVGDVI